MKTYKLILCTSVLSVIACVAQANNISNEIFLSNTSLNDVTYQSSSDGKTGPVAKPNQGTISQFTITTNGVCAQSSTSKTYPITVKSTDGKKLCQFNLVVSVKNDSQNVSSTNAAEVGTSGCDTDGSKGSGKIKDLQQYSSGTTDYCKVEWFKVNSTHGQVLIVIGSH